MAISTTIKNILENDATLSAILTGGVYDFEATGRQGITFLNVPAAFEDGVLLPCALVKARDKLQTDDIVDEAQQITSYRQIVQIWLYQEAGGYDAIEQAEARIYTLLHNTNVDKARLMFYNTDEGRQAEDLNGASFIRVEYYRFAIKT